MKNLLLLMVVLILPFALFSNDCINESKELHLKNKYTKSLNKLNVCLQDILLTKDRSLISDAYYGIGMNYFELGELDSSLKYLLLTEKILHNLPNEALYSRVLNDLSVCYINKGLNQYALFNLRKSLEINKKLNSTTSISKNYLNMGHASYNLNELDSAVRYYKLAFNYTNSNDVKQRNKIWNNLGVVYSKIGDYKSSIFYAKQVIKNLNDSYNRLDSLFYKTNLDMYYIASKSTKSVSDKSIEFNNNKQISNSRYFADAQFKSSIYYLWKDSMEKAITYLNKANSYYVSDGNITKAIEITTFFKNILNTYNQSINFNINKELINLHSKESNYFSDELEKELKIRESVEANMKILNKEVKFAWASFEFLMFILIFLIIIIPISIKYIFTKKILNKLRVNLIEYNDELIKIHENNIKNNIAKMTNLMALSNRFSDEDIFVNTIEKLHDGSNELSDHLFNFNKSHRSEYVNNGTNELQLDK
ncbi:MAG: hypothetical protein H6615_07080 [Ignavibacteria bacterium]|nr:hypothetical protein [Ignavibacteria bacterium]